MKFIAFQLRIFADSTLNLLVSLERQLNAVSSYPLESEEGRDSFMAISSYRLERIHDHLKANYISLLRSPPYTGKTTFAYALRDYLVHLNYQALYINLAGMDGSMARYDDKLFQDYWQAKVGFTWDELTECKSPTYVIVDEAQIIYGDCVPLFWGYLKEFLSNPNKNHNLRVLMVASYDPRIGSLRTPMQFTNALGLDALRLTLDELQQLTATFVEQRQRQDLCSESFTIPVPIQKAIFNLSGGHAGLCRITLKKIWERFCNGGSETQMLEYLVSSPFQRVLRTTRAFCWMENWNPTVEQSQFIRQALVSCDSESICNMEWTLNQHVEPFFKSGLFILINEQLQFTAPIMRMALGQYLFTASGCSSHLCATNFEEFMIRSIERMRPSVLRNSLGRGTGYLLERTWQFEWYRAAVTAAPADAVVSPDVGAIFGSPGYLDFYVNGRYSWGIELLREGNRAEHHAARFGQSGMYEKIPMKEHVLIDFRKSADVGKLRGNFWYAIYSDDYRTITIKRLGHADQVITLHGDDV